MRLNRLFWLITVTIIALVIGPCAIVVGQQWDNFRGTADNLRELEKLRQALVLAELASAERGPSNGYMGAKPGDAAIAEKLRKARATTDSALNALRQSLSSNAMPEETYVIQLLADAEQRLNTGRTNVDRQGALPPEARKSDDVQAAVQSMFDVIQPLSLAVNELSRLIKRSNPNLIDAIIAARLTADLREYAGRIGSMFTAAVAAQRPLSETEWESITRLQGRLEELHVLLGLRIRRGANVKDGTGGADDPRDDAALQAAYSEMNQHYFGEGQGFIDNMKSIGHSSGNYGISTAEFAARYVPTMKGITKVRDVMLKRADDNASKRHEHARLMLIVTSGTGCLAMFLLFITMRVFRYRVLRMLMRTTKVFVALARGKLDTSVPLPAYPDEFADLLEAAATLKNNGLEKIKLEKEREDLIERLRHSADTDFLTGLLNRRAFYRIAGKDLANRTEGSPVALILLDIDRFKLVNDRYGHVDGDTVLRDVASLCRNICRKTDLVVRYGGEEFIIYAPDCDLAAAMSLAEQIRSQLEHQRSALSNGFNLAITASFGVTVRRGRELLDELVERADVALYAAKHQGRNQVVAGENLSILHVV